MIRTATHLSNNGMTFDNIKHACLFESLFDDKKYFYEYFNK